MEVPSKEWMKLADRGDEYEAGVNRFLDFAFDRLKVNKIRCPCVDCMNVDLHTREEVLVHLLKKEILPRYTYSYHHGETVEEFYASLDAQEKHHDPGVTVDREMNNMLNDLYPEINGVDSPGRENQEEEPNDEVKGFYRLLKQSQEPVYEGCETSRLSALVKLLHMKTLGRWSNESFTMLLHFLKEELLPKASNLPESYYDAKKTLKDLGLSYVKIDACVNNCMLFWKDGDEKLDACKVCKASRWMTDTRSGEIKCKVNGKKIPHKILRYFPLKPRLQRLYMSSMTASLMRWHHQYKTSKKKDDTTMRHPVDSAAWQSFLEKHQEFASELRNVFLGLASDGFQPFTNSKTPYSIWPVFLIPYNLPPELCTKDPYLILSMLIPGPDSPGNAIDIYLQPLIEELKELWDIGVKTYDASVRSHFQLRAALLWTINDFPAYECSLVG